MPAKTDRETVALINESLRVNVEKQDWEKLEGNLFVGLKYGGSKTLRKKAALALGRHHANRDEYLQAISAFEHLRLLAPTQRNVVREELNVLRALLDEAGSDASRDDLLLLLAIARLISTPRRKPAGRGKGSPADKSIEIDLSRRINELLPEAPRKGETRVSFLLDQIFNALDPNLTPEEKLRKAAKILAPHILRRIIKVQKDMVIAPPKPAQANGPDKGGQPKDSR